MKVLYRRHRALALALIPVVYLVLQKLLFVLADVMRYALKWDGLMWQCTGALAYTMFVLGPVVFVCTGLACLVRSVQKLCRKEQVRRHAALIPVALATAVLSALYFWQYWYV